MKKTTLAALAMSLCAATSAHAEKPTDPQTELIVNLAVTTASVDRCHFEIDSRIIGLDLLKELNTLEFTYGAQQTGLVRRAERRQARCFVS